MDLLTVIIITFTFSALLLSYMAQQIKDEKKRRIFLSQLLEEQNELLTRRLQGEDVSFENNYETTKNVLDRVYHTNH